MIETTYNRRRRSRGFTLTELLVAVAILAAMMTLIATIFNSAGKAAGTAQSSQKLYRTLQQTAETIKRDLERMTPKTDRILAIAGVEVAAYETRDDLGTGRILIDDPAVTPNDLHRADVMMLVTPRTVRPFIANGIDSTNLDPFKHVVYGHALPGRLSPTGWNIQGLSDAPASRWHLARRITGFQNSGTATSGTHAGELIADEFTNQVSGAADLADVFEGTFDSLTAGLLPGFYVYRDAASGTASLFSYYLYNSFGSVPGPYTFNPMRLSSGGAYYWMQTDPALPPGAPLEGALLWWEAVGTTSPSGWRRTDDVTGNIDYAGSPFPAQPGQPDGPPGASYFEFQPPPPPYWPYWPNWFYNGQDTRVVIDPNPSLLADAELRMASYFLPACSEFKVEVTFENPRSLPLMEDGGNYFVAMADLDGNGLIEENIDAPAPEPIEWLEVPHDEIWVWYDMDSTSAYAGTNDSRQYTDPFVWPTAIRITITAYDPAANLDRPVTTTIVHKF